MENTDSERSSSKHVPRSFLSICALEIKQCLGILESLDTNTWFIFPPLLAFTVTRYEPKQQDIRAIASSVGPKYTRFGRTKHRRFFRRWPATKLVSFNGWFHRFILRWKNGARNVLGTTLRQLGYCRACICKRLGKLPFPTLASHMCLNFLRDFWWNQGKSSAKATIHLPTNQLLPHLLWIWAHSHLLKKGIFLKDSPHRLKCLISQLCCFFFAFKKREKWKALDFISWFDIFDILNSGAVNHPWGLIELITCWMDPKRGMHKWSRKNMVHATPHHLSMSPQATLKPVRSVVSERFFVFTQLFCNKSFVGHFAKHAFFEDWWFWAVPNKNAWLYRKPLLRIKTAKKKTRAKGRTNERQKIRLSQFSCRMDENRPSDAATSAT